MGRDNAEVNDHPCALIQLSPTPKPDNVALLMPALYAFFSICTCALSTNTVPCQRLLEFDHRSWRISNESESPCEPETMPLS